MVRHKTAPIKPILLIFSVTFIMSVIVATPVWAEPSVQVIQGPSLQANQSSPQLKPFKIERTEVTIGQFAAYAQKYGIQTEAQRQGGGYEFRMGWQQQPGWYYKQPYGRAATPQEPAVHISWAEAQAYCQAQGGRLPTKDQWLVAAYTETREQPAPPFKTGQTYPYPTGDSPTGANTVGDQDGWPEHAPVKSFAPGVNGLYDMGANVWEWLADGQGEDRLTAGGSWWYGPNKMTSSGMQSKPAQFFAVYVGFRCVYDL